MGVWVRVSRRKVALPGAIVMGYRWLRYLLLVAPCVGLHSACLASAAAPSEDGGSGAQEGGNTVVHDGGNHAQEAGASSGPDAGSPADAGITTAAPYKVMGAQILDRNGHTHLFRGLDRPSLEWSCSGDITEIDYQTMAQAWHANVVRLPLNQDCWIQDSTNQAYDSGYQGIVDAQVRWAKKYNMDIILDLHWSDKGDYGVGYHCLNTSGANCQQDMADAHSVTFWQQVASKYKNDPQVLFELYNEPKVGGYSPSAANWDTWLNGGMSSGFAVHGMQELYSTVRNAGADNLVIVGGLDWSFDLSGVASHAVMGTNIVYNTHVYNQNPESSWYSSFAYLAANYPVIATEFGDHSGSCSTKLNTDFTSYAEANAVGGSMAPTNKLSWTAWAFYYSQNACTFPALLNNDWMSPNAMGQAVQSALIAGP
jgi:endoglucanase